MLLLFKEISESNTPALEQNEGKTSDCNCRSFPVDLIIATLEQENKETLAMLVKENVHQGIEFCFHANFTFCFTKSIWPQIKCLRAV